MTTDNKALADRQAWYEEQIASAESHWIDSWQERYEDGDDVPDKEHFVALWLAERAAPSPQARPDGGEAYGWLEPSTGNFVDHATKVAMPADASSFTLALYTHPTPAPDAVARLVEAVSEVRRERNEGYVSPATFGKLWVAVDALTAAQQESKS